MCTRVRKTRKIGEVRGGGKVLKRWMNVRWSAESSVWPERYEERFSDSLNKLENYFLLFLNAFIDKTSHRGAFWKTETILLSAHDEK